MPVRAIKDERRCKICRSEKRTQIDALLELRSNAGRDENDVRVTAVYVTERMKEWGIANPTLENIKIHWQKHCEVVSDEMAANLDAAVLRAVMAGEQVDVDTALRTMYTIGFTELTEKVKNGQKSGIGPDLLVKISDAITRRKTSDAQSELLNAVGGGIRAALAGRRAPELEEATIDAEFVEVDDAG